MLILLLNHCYFVTSQCLSFMIFACHQAPKSVLISCKDGTVLHVEAPDPGKYDTSKTYHLPLTNLKTKEYHFKSVKDKLRVGTREVLLPFVQQSFHVPPRVGVLIKINAAILFWWKSNRKEITIVALIQQSLTYVKKK